MTASLRAAVAVGLTGVVCGATAAPAIGATDCGSIRRPFTDARPLVSITKGSLRCATARGVMRAYWNRSVDAFTRTVRLRHAGIRWVCRPTVAGEVPTRWACRGGGPARNRFRVAARE